MSNPPTREPPAGEAASSLDAALLARVGARIARYAGLVMPGWVLEARLRERIDALGLPTPDAYADLVTSPRGADEFERLLEALRVGETRFFRHAGQIRALVDTVVPALDKSRAGKRVRAWSAGCASGEEPYTLAMILIKRLTRPDHDVHILATDLSRHAIAAARAACYPASALDQVPEEWRHAFVRADDGAFVGADEGAFVRVADRVARCVTFEQRNLLDSLYPGRFDIILCRNVLIYLTPAARQQAIANLVASLASTGALLVGYSEALRDVSELVAERVGDAVIYRKATGDQARMPRTTDPLGLAGTARGAPAPSSASGPARASSPALSSASSAASSPASLPASLGTPGRAPASGSGRTPQSGRVRASSPAPAPGAPAPARHATSPDAHVIRLAGSYEDDDRLQGELASALASQHTRVLIDLDGAGFLGDGAAAILRRASQTASAAGQELILQASRPGPRRWLRRHGLGAPKDEDEDSLAGVVLASLDDSDADRKPAGAESAPDGEGRQRP